jgi:hypothetical protein
MKKCNHDNLKHFELRHSVLCVDCGMEWFNRARKLEQEKIDKIISMVKDGYSFREITSIVGLSRQRCHQIYKKYNLKKV